MTDNEKKAIDSDLELTDEDTDDVVGGRTPINEAGKRGALP